jgi:hypothetical protein
MQVREMITSSTASSRPTPLFHFYDANHLYLMTIALTRKNKNNNTTPRYKSSIAKKTYPITIAKLVPNFAARWRSICKYLNSSENKRSEKRCKIQQQYKENATRLYSEKKLKEDLEQSSQSHHNSQFNLSKQAYAQYENALQTEQSDAPCNFIKLYHLYLMKIALIKKNQQEKRQHHLKISSIRNKDDLSHQKRGESSKFRR